MYVAERPEKAFDTCKLSKRILWTPRLIHWLKISNFLIYFILYLNIVRSNVIVLRQNKYSISNQLLLRESLHVEQYWANKPNQRTVQYVMNKYLN